MTIRKTLSLVLAFTLAVPASVLAKEAPRSSDMNWAEVQQKANQTIQTAQEEAPDLYAEALLEVDRIEREVNSKSLDELIERYGELMILTRTEERNLYSEEELSVALTEMLAIEMKDAQTPETNISGLAYELTFGPGGTHEGIEFVEASSWAIPKPCVTSSMMFLVAINSWLGALTTYMAEKKPDQAKTWAFMAIGIFSVGLVASLFCILD